MSRRLTVTCRFEHELKKKIEEHEKRGYKLYAKGETREGRGSVERTKYWAVFIEKPPGE